MPWVRIEEKALTHPKIIGLSDGAFRLWVAGLAHCQQHLTDGTIPAAIIRTLIAVNPRRILELFKAGLWLKTEDGAQVHDYLQHNESRAVVLAKREAAKQRMRSKRTSPERSQGSSREPSRELREKFACGVVLDPPVAAQKGGESLREGAGTRGGKIAFDGRFLTVHRWQFTEMGKRLAERNRTDFDLLPWFERVEAEIERDGITLPGDDRERWNWLLSKLYADADLPLPTLSARTKTAGNQTAASRWLQRRAQ